MSGKKRRPPKVNPMKPVPPRPQGGDKVKLFKPGMKMGKVVG